jgi:lantibiotic biosynthesis protein
VFLEEAISIADYIASRAIHVDDRCSWVCRSAIPPRPTMKDSRPTVEMLGPSILAGTAGMALFFAHVSLKSTDQLHRETALAAIRHAIRFSEYAQSGESTRIGGPSNPRQGFYLGTIGVVWAAEEVSELLEDGWVAKKARQMAARFCKRLDGNVDSDLLSGVAGVIPALLDLERKGFRETDGHAERLGRLLYRQTQAGKESNRVNGKRLTGLSHGASGLGLAFSALFQASGRDIYREASLETFMYERDVFNPSEGGWPDFLKPLQSNGRPQTTIAWCHGAGGIGLSRAFALQTLKEQGLRSDAKVAYQSLASDIAENFQSPGRNFCLCHGLAGNAECASIIADAIGVKNPLDLPRKVARFGIERFGIEAQEKWGDVAMWPTSTPGIPYPPLLQGITGVGLFLLRLDDPESIGSILLPGNLLSGKKSRKEK